MKAYSVVIDGETVTFEFKDSLIHREGEAAGNIDAIITTKPPLPQNLLLDELHIRLPGSDELLYIYGYGVVENSLKATFNLSGLIDMEKLPETVEVYWGASGDLLIGEMRCQQYTEQAESGLSEEINNEVAEEVENEEQNREPIKEITDVELSNKNAGAGAPGIGSKINIIVASVVAMLVIILIVLFI